MVCAADLTRLALFQGFAVEDLELIAGYMVRSQYARGEVVFRRGEPGRAIYVIEDGWVKISFGSPDGKEVTLALLGPGEFFGELAVLDGQPRSADAVALEPTGLLVLLREDLRRDLEARPRIAVQLLAVLSRRLREADGIIAEAAFLDVPGRLARALLRLDSTDAGPARGTGSTTAPRLTQTELAGLVGATRESVGKCLVTFERSGLIRRRGGRISVLRPDELRQRAT
jgi:CRP/FNR family transcriptional regulator, cyclic AMP receptor protein